jgi:hypothetical protein
MIQKSGGAKSLTACWAPREVASFFFNGAYDHDSFYEPDVISQTGGGGNETCHGPLASTRAASVEFSSGSLQDSFLNRINVSQ